MGIDAVSPLRQRMIEDMTARKLSAGTQKAPHPQLQALRRIPPSAHPTRPPAEDVRRFQLHLAETGDEHPQPQPPHDRAAVHVPRDAAATGISPPAIYHLREPQKIPQVMSPDETRRLLAVATSLKARVLLSLSYGCGLRAGEVVRLKVKHIDSAQRIIRIEQSKGRKDRHVMLSPETLDVLRQWWKARRGFDATTPLQERWLFPGRRPGTPMTTRQLSRLFHEAVDEAGIKKSVTLHALRHSFATHLLERGTDIEIIQALLGHDKLDTTARYTRVATGMIAGIESPLDLLSLPRKRPRRNRREHPTA